LANPSIQRSLSCVAFTIQPLVHKLKSYIKDTTDFLIKIKNHPKTHNKTLLVSVDIISLYTNIPHEEGINACIHLIENIEHYYRHLYPIKPYLKHCSYYICFICKRHN